MVKITGTAKIYLEKSAVGGKTKLLIDAEKIEEFIENKIIKIPIPQVSQSNQNANVPLTKYKDLKRLNHAYSIQGSISAQQSSSSTSDFYDDQITVKGDNTVTLSAAEAKNALIYYILYPYGDITMYWRGFASSSATPATALSSLMDATDTERSTTVVFEKIQFVDAPATLREFLYNLIGLTFNQQGEVGAKKYKFNMTVVKGVNF